MYESYYGLNSKPFQLTPDPEFFFASKLHKRAMSYLQYGLSQAEGFIVITGDIGTGKTTIANSLLNDIEADIHAAQIVTPKLSPDEIVKMVTAKFGIDTTGKSKTDLLEALQKFLEDLASTGKRALLLVDEAQNLPLETIEELRMLSNFQQNGKPLLQSFLLGQAELQPILRAPNMEQFRQRIVASCHLAPLNFDETCAYIKYRLEHAGCTRTNLFSDEAFKAIHKFTTGVPRKVNTLMDRVLLFGFLEELDTFSVNDVNKVIEEVKEEMFLPEEVMAPETDEILVASALQSKQASAQQVLQTQATPQAQVPPQQAQSTQEPPQAQPTSAQPVQAPPPVQPLQFETPSEPVPQVQPLQFEPTVEQVPEVQPLQFKPTVEQVPQTQGESLSAFGDQESKSQSLGFETVDAHKSGGSQQPLPPNAEPDIPFLQPMSSQEQQLPEEAPKPKYSYNPEPESAATAAPIPPVDMNTERPVHVTKNGNVVHEAQYYKDMLEELVDALDDAIKHKVKLTQYIDKLLKKKYQTYVRLKSDDDK